MLDRKVTRALSASLLGVATVALPVAAQASAGAPAGSAPPAQAAPHESLAPRNAPKSTIYLASRSTGSNNRVIIGDDGVILVDTGITPDSEKAKLAQMTTLTWEPMTTVILTHSDGDKVVRTGAPAFQCLGCRWRDKMPSVLSIFAFPRRI